MPIAQSISVHRAYQIFLDVPSTTSIRRTHRNIETIRPKVDSVRSASRENKRSEAIRYLPLEFSRVARNEFSLRGYTSIKREIPYRDSLSLPASLLPICFLTDKLNKTRAPRRHLGFFGDPLDHCKNAERALASSTFDSLHDFPRARRTRSEDTSGRSLLSLPLHMCISAICTRIDARMHQLDGKGRSIRFPAGHHW